MVYSPAATDFALSSKAALVKVLPRFNLQLAEFCKFTCERSHWTQTVPDPVVPAGPGLVTETEPGERKAVAAALWPDARMPPCPSLLAQPETPTLRIPRSAATTVKFVLIGVPYISSTRGDKRYLWTEAQSFVQKFSLHRMNKAGSRGSSE
jgi:hypothetical protein